MSFFKWLFRKKSPDLVEPIKAVKNRYLSASDVEELEQEQSLIELHLARDHGVFGVHGRTVADAIHKGVLTPEQPLVARWIEIETLLEISRRNY